MLEKQGNICESNLSKQMPSRVYFQLLPYVTLNALPYLWNVTTVDIWASFLKQTWLFLFQILSGVMLTFAKTHLYLMEKLYFSEHNDEI